MSEFTLCYNILSVHGLVTILVHVCITGEKQSMKSTQICIFRNSTTHQSAAIAQLGERETEDLKVTGSIPVGGNTFTTYSEEHTFMNTQRANSTRNLLRYDCMKISSVL